MNIDSSRYDIGITLIYQHEHFLRFKMYTLRPEKIFSNWKRFKIDKKCVFLSWKLFSFLRCLGFSPDFFAHLGKLLVKKGEVDFNKTRKFGQLIEHNTRNIFLKKLYTKCGGEISPRTFSKKLKLSISLNQQPEILHTLFLLYVKTGSKSRTTKIHWNHGVDGLLLTSIKLFYKINRDLELVSLPDFLHNFRRKIFLPLYSISWPIFNVWFLLLLEILGNVWFPLLLICHLLTS